MTTTTTKPQTTETTETPKVGDHIVRVEKPGDAMKNVDYTVTTSNRSAVGNVTITVSDRVTAIRYPAGTKFTIQRDATDEEIADREYQAFTFAVTAVRNEIASAHAKLTKAVDAFVDRMRGDRPTEAIRWNGEALAMAQATHECWASVGHAMGNMEGTSQDVRILRAVECIVEEVKAEALRVRGSSGSTCAYTNAVERDLLVGKIAWTRHHVVTLALHALSTID